MSIYLPVASYVLVSFECFWYVLFFISQLPEDVVEDQEEDLEAETVAGEAEVVVLVAAEEAALVVEIGNNFKCHPVLCK